MLGRTAQLGLKEELLAPVISFLIEHGCSDASLRPLATALKISPYKLLYHFGSRDGLLAVAIAEAERRQVEEVRSWLELAEVTTAGDLLRRYWQWFCRNENVAVFRLFVEVNGLALRKPDTYQEVFSTIFREGLELEQRALRRASLSGAELKTTATLACAVVWGLQLDYLNTLDGARTSAALNTFAGLLDAHIASWDAAKGGTYLPR